MISQTKDGDTEIGISKIIKEGKWMVLVQILLTKLLGVS